MFGTICNFATSKNNFVTYICDGQRIQYDRTSMKGTNMIGRHLDRKRLHQKNVRWFKDSINSYNLWIVNLRL